MLFSNIPSFLNFIENISSSFDLLLKEMFYYKKKNLNIFTLTTLEKIKLINLSSLVLRVKYKK